MAGSVDKDMKLRMSFSYYTRRPSRAFIKALFILSTTVAGIPAHAAPDPVDATRLFAEAATICTRDHGALWGRSLCGPILLVDYTDRSVLANQADGEGRLAPDGPLFRGVLSEEVLIANTPTAWSRHRVDPDRRTRYPPTPPGAMCCWPTNSSTVSSPAWAWTRPEQANAHLDTLEGRYQLQLEWRALAVALKATSTKARRAAIADALAFRHARYRLFPDAAREEAALEINEGIAEYTGVRLGLAHRARTNRLRARRPVGVRRGPKFRALVRLRDRVPAYGLLLDQADPAWRVKLATGQRLDELLATAPEPAGRGGPARPRPRHGRRPRYDDGTLRRFEVQRDQERQARLAAFKARLVDGPVLTLPLAKSNTQFNPQTLVPLAGLGTVYPTMRLTDDWGSLEVEHGGALVQGAAKQATVSAVGADPSGT